MVYYFVCWFLVCECGKVNSFFMLFIVVVLVLVVLMFGWIIEYLNILDYEGWCWFFVIEGIFIVFFGILIFYLLFDSLEKVKWFML